MNIRSLFTKQLMWFFLLAAAIAFLNSPTKVHAQEACSAEIGAYVQGDTVNKTAITSGQADSLGFTIAYSHGLKPNTKYYVTVWQGGWQQIWSGERNAEGSFMTPSTLSRDSVHTAPITLRIGSGAYEKRLFNMSAGEYVLPDSQFERKVLLRSQSDTWAVCQLGTYQVTRSKYTCTNPPVFSQQRTFVDESGKSVTKTCFATAQAGCLEKGAPIKMSAGTFMHGNETYTDSLSYSFKNGGTHSVPNQNGEVKDVSITSGGDGFEIDFNAGSSGGWIFDNCSASVKIVNSCGVSCIEDISNLDDGPVGSAFDLCSQVANTTNMQGVNAYQKCQECADKNGVWTAVGCIQTEPSSIVKALITIGVGIGGGVALLMTLVGGFLLTTSQGNPKQQETAKEMITSAVIGLLFVLFSVIILQFIGVTILQIPGFGTTGS